VVARSRARAASAANWACVRGGGEVGEGANLKVDGLVSDFGDQKKQ